VTAGDRPYHGKRALDLLITLILSLPAVVLGGICSAMILIDDGRPVFFRQQRVGRAGVTFDIVKFRTMHHAAEPNPLFPSASHITRVGRILRRLSLDELPQLLNVAIGEMSIVGPRPTLPYQVERYTTEQRERLAVKPGITGLAQVRGRNALSWTDRIELDREYLRRQSVLFDLWILALSVGTVFRGSGVEGHPVDDPIAQIDGTSQ
jgi:lipopolysaccharide/colanic/teichoic acid biosynthesis glycosyltransferase